jgi:hypothetical protein
VPIKLAVWRGGVQWVKYCYRWCAVVIVGGKELQSYRVRLAET